MLCDTCLYQISVGDCDLGETFPCSACEKYEALNEIITVFNNIAHAPVKAPVKKRGPYVPPPKPEPRPRLYNRKFKLEL